MRHFWGRTEAQELYEDRKGGYHYAKISGPRHDVYVEIHRDGRVLTRWRQLGRKGADGRAFGRFARRVERELRR